MVPTDTIIKLMLLIREILSKVYYWWKMPAVLVLLYQFNERDHLFKNNLYDAYPGGNNPVKEQCNDPVVGYYHIGCYYRTQQYPCRTKQLPYYESCTRYCASHGYPYAGFSKPYRMCRCLKTETVSKATKRSDKHCNVLSGNRYGTPHYYGCYYYLSMDVYRTMKCTERMRRVRTIDGTCNDLNKTAMGSRLYRFGRNVPLNYTFEDNYMLEPNPRTISQRALLRKEFIPVKQLNMLAAGWIQFMLHDWFDHGEQDTKHRIHVPLERNDPNYSHDKPSMSIARTKLNNCSEDKSKPTTYQNDVTHWWDMSQIYGSDLETNRKVRTLHDGKLELDDKGLLPLNEKTGIDITGFNNNWWVGIALLHNIFTREHNAICDMLRENNPHWTDQQLYDTARLINAAVAIKIHTIEWTPAILNYTALRAGVRVNWGLDPGKEIWEWLKKHNISSNIGIKPLVGQPRNLQGVPFSLTEEFVSVYRMHPLLPDYLNMRSMETRERTGKSYTLPNYSFSKAREIFQSHSFDDILYTFGVEHPGALTLFNYPKFLTDLKLPSHQMNGEIVDLATIDILRDRERGVPRYNEFRRLMNLRPVDSFDKLTTNKEHADVLKSLYCNDISKLDLLIGSLAEEPRPPGFGFGETSFNLFLFMASRRLEADR
uniref:Alpha-dioxygenase 2-like n=1 Tax=Actinia tenebrosa TaxID=6105 RepID=A0A6P8I6A4_ACTTE